MRGGNGVSNLIDNFLSLKSLNYQGMGNNKYQINIHNLIDNKSLYPNA